MASESERRAKLLSLKNSVRAYFEMTTVAPRQKGHPWGAAFRAVRSNDYMAESFIEELQALLDYIEAAFATAPPREAPREPEPELEDDPASEDETHVAGPRGMAPQRKVVPTRGRESPPAEEARLSRPVRAPPSSPPRPMPRAVAAPPPPIRPASAAPARPAALPTRPSAPVAARPSAPVAARPVAEAAPRQSSARPAAALPSPARPLPGATRKNQFVEMETTVSAPPSFGVGDHTGPANLPPESPRRRR